MTVADTDAAAPLHARTFVDPDHAEHPLSVTGQTVLLFQYLPVVRLDHLRHRVDHVAVRNRLPARGRFRRRNQRDLIASDEFAFTHHQSHTLPPVFATIFIRTLRTGEARFVRQKHALVYRVLHPRRQQLESPERGFIAAGVVRFADRILRLGDHVEPEKRRRAVQLFVGIRKNGRLQIAVGFPGGPAARRGFPIHDTGVPPILNDKVKLADQRLVQSGNVNLERLRHPLDRVVIRPVCQRRIQHLGRKIDHRVEVLAFLVDQVRGSFGFDLERLFKPVNDFIAGQRTAHHALPRLSGQRRMERFAEREADRSPFDLGVIHVAVHELRLTDIEIRIQRRIRPMRFLSQFVDGRHYAALHSSI